MPNPFHFNRPTRPEEFLGRGEIVAGICEALYDWSGDSYGIIGGRRFGKTSLLKALEDQLLNKLKQVQIGDLHVVPVFVSLKTIEPSSLGDVFGIILHRIKQVIYGVKRPPPFKERPVELELRDYTPRNATPATLQDVEAEVEHLVAVAFPQVGNLRIALLIDEMDCVLDLPWTGTLFGMLRSLVYDGPVCDYVRFVLAGSGRYLSVDEHGSPLLNAIKACYLEPLAQDAVRALVERAAGIPPDVAGAVLQQGGGHPFLLQYLLHYLAEGDVASSTVSKVSDEVQHFMYDRGFDLDGWWYAIGKDGRSVYALLTKTGDWITHADLIQADKSSELDVDRGLKALCYHGLAIHDETFQKYCVSGALFKDWTSKKREAQSGRPTDKGAGDPAQFRQQAGTNAIQFGQVSGGNIIIQRLAEQSPPLVEIRPERNAKLLPVVEALKKHFDREEFRTVCFNIGANYDDLAPGGLADQAMQLVLSCDRTGYLETLLAEIRRVRPGTI